LTICKFSILVEAKNSKWKKNSKNSGWSPMDLPVKWHFSEYKFDMKYVFQDDALGIL